MKSSVLIGLSRHRIGVDGAGVTTLVAFHGYPLDCKYCLNPQALSSKGVWKRYTPEELYNHVKQDDLYFRATRGGATFGGGEPLISCKEIMHFHKICRDKGHDWKKRLIGWMMRRTLHFTSDGVSAHNRSRYLGYPVRLVAVD